MILLLLLVSVACISFILTHQMRKYAHNKGLIDTPNDRSSHTLPTPRSGGNAIVLSFCAGLIIYSLSLTDESIPFWIWGLMGSGFLVAMIGWIDDHGHIAARWRLLIHFITATWSCYWLEAHRLPPIPVLGFEITLEWLAVPFVMLYLVWMLNLYNFMDGINGIASIEVISVGLGIAVLSFLVTNPMSEPGIYISIVALLMAATMGFIPWNFPNAKIFMGDAGSGFIGMVLGSLSIQAIWLAPQLFWCWLIMLGVFVADATTTLVCRVMNNERAHEAHRNHAYQYASRVYNSHTIVTSCIAAINICFLLPLAVCVAQEKLDGGIGLILAYAPLIALALYFKAGNREQQRC